MKLHPQGIQGPWNAGLVLDWHTVDSQCIGENEFGYPVFETTRSEIGELLYQFKYRSNDDALRRIVAIACKYLIRARGKFDLVLPVPPSNPDRTVTQQIARGVAECLGADFNDRALEKRVGTQELKSISDPERRKEILAGAFLANPEMLKDRTVLLVDDLYRSGATLEACTNAVMNVGLASRVYVMAVTRTRINR